MAENERNGGGGFLFGLLMGAVGGFVAGMVFAPKSGEETRAFILDQSREWRDKADELTSAARERMASAASEGRYAASQLRDAGSFNNLDLDDQEL
ncbi:MAG: YtxH domain-containing protein [Chloroflexota bacterium]|nr:YtxH domain-containing protein [Chloroflexota bacterium]MQG37248.1 YtxH domain-containing protein [SAR202 cluster bacterium]|tara:strand:+ start:5819 stop:6103 length:285 start_codon:yes stop_codon:yes gene_type:complete